MQVFTMTVPMDTVISNNRTAPVWKRTKTKNTMRQLTDKAASNLTPCGKATIFIGITKRTKTVYDPVNLSDTFKGCVDQLVTMGILDKDDYHYVLGPFLYHAGSDKRIPDKHLRATVTLTDYSTIPF